MSYDNSESPKSWGAFLPKLVFVIGVVLVVGSGLMVVATMSTQQASQAAAGADVASNDTVVARAETSSGPNAMGRLIAALSSVVEPPKSRWELDQAALPATPEGWGVAIGVGGGQSHALAKQVYDAMHNPEGPLDIAALDVLSAAQQPSGLMSEALSGASSSMQAMGASEEEAAAQLAVNPLMVRLGDGIARKNDQYDQGRVYVSGDDVVMVMVRRLPQAYRSKGSWLQITSPGVAVPVTLGNRTFMESARTADSDEIHALRLDITSHLFIEIGGRVDREVLESFAQNIDFASL